ncbi:RNA-binding protein MEX3B-like [Gigantopelta aegis]|uniref:RNA-binding protein MEX3B-like n=1 Tax=Gigantopelta aegis TaxID=1735272 RepID=UPI001B88AA61|nr:RNA-binding protein MEX3B-like [Gigantopelta aegis]XP_041370791.1 RNA-binding protein MEX3B-like [Gigantopelta aegis]
MLASILTAAVPVVATLAVALYVLRKIQQTYGNVVNQRVPDISVDGQLDSGYYSGNVRENRAHSARHRRPHPYQNRGRASGASGSSADSGSGLQSASEDVQVVHAFEGFEIECAICFEQLSCVQVYPCNHSGICINCINKIITDGDRLCPFCRRFIQAYRN